MPGGGIRETHKARPGFMKLAVSGDNMSTADSGDAGAVLERNTRGPPCKWRAVSKELSTKKLHQT